MDTRVSAWWAYIAQGVLAASFGVLAFFWPGIALLTLVFLFGMFAILFGVLRIAAAFDTGAARARPRWGLLIHGVLSIVAGGLAFFLPGITALALLYVIAAWAIVTGAMEIAAAIRLRRVIKGEWLLGLAGALSIIFGVLVALFPGAGALAMVLWISAYAIVLGALLIAVGIRMLRWGRAHEPRVRGFAAVATGH